MANKTVGLIGMGLVLFLFACKSIKTSKGVVQTTHIDSLQDSSRLSFYKGDTVSYINYVVKNQSKYVGKPLSELLKDLEIPIYTFSYSPNSRNRYRITNLTLSAKPYNSPGIINGVDQEITFGIGWQTFVSPDSIAAITKANGLPYPYKWSDKAKEYFGKQIVGNLWLRNYMKK